MPAEGEVREVEVDRVATVLVELVAVTSVTLLEVGEVD